MYNTGSLILDTEPKNRDIYIKNKQDEKRKVSEGLIPTIVEIYVKDNFLIMDFIYPVRELENKKNLIDTDDVIFILGKYTEKILKIKMTIHQEEELRNNFKLARREIEELIKAEKLEALKRSYKIIKHFLLEKEEEIIEYIFKK